MPYSNFALQTLESQGYKITSPRKKVIQALSIAPKALSPYELQKLIKSKPILNPVTIYRVLELLLELKLVHKVSSGGFLKCSLLQSSNAQSKNSCHHFLICNDCGTTKEFVEPRSHLHLPENLKSEFKVTNHTYELSGLCKKCFT